MSLLNPSVLSKDEVTSLGLPWKEKHLSQWLQISICVPSEKSFYLNQVLEDKHRINVNVYLQKDETTQPKLKRLRTDVPANWEHVGLIKGYLLSRPQPKFQSEASQMCDELRRITSSLFDPSGAAVKLPNVALSKGDLLHIEFIETTIRAGIDLGLFMIHHLLLFVRERWSLLTMDIYSLPASCSDFPQNQAWLLPPNIPQKRIMTPQEERQLLDRKLKVQRHFARLGLQQAGHTAELANLWYLTNEQYFSRSSDVWAVPSTWLSKQEALSLEIYVPPTARQIRAANDRLRKAIPRNDQETIQRAIAEGATIDGVEGIQLAVMTCSELEIIDFLIEQGGTLNKLDEHMGQTPLHIACGKFDHAMIYKLISKGANLEYQNRSRQMPVQTFIGMFESHRKHIGEKTLLKNSQYMKTLLGSLSVLTPNSMKVTYIDHWLSPRVRRALMLTATDCAERIRQCGDEFPVEEGVLPFTQMELFEYLPLTIDGVTKHFLEGWACMFDAIELTLKNNMTPTVFNVQQFLIHHHLHQRKENSIDVETFAAQGGKVEYAVDCALDLMTQDWQMLPLESLPITPMDLVLSLVRFKCFEGCSHIPKGPYLADLEDDDDDDEKLENSKVDAMGNNSSTNKNNSSKKKIENAVSKTPEKKKEKA